MGLTKRVLHILIGIGLIIITLLLAVLGEDGPDVIALILGISMLFYGVRSLVAFFTKFRFVIGGRSQLYIGIIALDLGLLIISSFSGSTFLILLYLLGIRLVTGGIDLARAIESKKNSAPWRTKLISAFVSLGTVILGLIFFRDPETVVDIYCIGLLFSAVEHFITAFRRTRVVTIA